MPKVSVVITAHNYAKFLPQAINSVRAQSFDDWELIVVNDGSTDHTDEVLKPFLDQPRIRVLDLPGLGLAKAANIGIRASIGEYVIRLDADDYFDENILLILSNILDRNANYGMVYPDFYRITRHGAMIDQVRQQKVNDEVKLLDRSALAAGALYRRSCYETLGGYNEELSYQEDYDFWIRFIDKFHVYNVQLPLMYYRQHQLSMSTNRRPRMEARRYVKHKFVTESRDLQQKRVACVLPIVASSRFKPRLPLLEVGGKPLLSYVIEEAKKIELFDRILVDTEDEEIAEAALSLGVEVPFMRPRELARPDVYTSDVVKHFVRSLREHEGYSPDILLVSSYMYPFISAAHMEEAVDTLMIYKCNSVVSVTTDLKFHWRPGENGLTAINYPTRLLFDERWTMYEERGGIYAIDVANLTTDDFLGSTISHIEVDEIEGLRMDTEFNLWTARRLLENPDSPLASRIQPVGRKDRG